MKIFTGFVRSLASPSRPPGAHEVARLGRALRRALRSELQRRGLWEKPPSYLGVVGWSRWGETPDGETQALGGGGGDALDELTVECYAFIFVDRLRSLQAQLQLKPDIEGLVVLDIRHFLHDRQKAHDPLGFRLFEVLHAAVRLSLEMGELHILRGDRRIRNETILGWRGEETPTRGAAAVLRSLVARWNDELLPDLVTAQGGGRAAIVNRLRRHLSELRAAGVESFSFHDLVEALKHDVRPRWAAMMVQSTAGENAVAEGRDDLGEAVRITLPDCDADERESFEYLSRRVAESLDQLATDERMRRYLANLWDYLCQQASPATDPVSSPQHERDLVLEPAAGAVDRPSQRTIAKQLHIPRARLPELLEVLGRLVEQCRMAEPKQPGPRRRWKE
jgi:hypothetical protein